MAATIYSGYSDTALYALFRSESWFGTAERRGLTLDEKHQALQELENRSAAEYGASAVPVRLEVMTGVGMYSPGTRTISISETFVDHGTLVSSRTGHEFYINGSPEGSNMRCMANIYHEGWHAAQHQSESNPAIYGADTERQRDVIANLHNYIRSTPENYHLYRIQLVEREANEYGFQKTAEAMKATEPYFGKEQGMAQLEQQIRQQYQTSLQEAQLRYGDDVVDMMQTAMNDAEYNGGLIRSNMSAGYYATRSILVNQQLDTLQKTMEQLPEGADRSAYEAKLAELNRQLGEIDAARQAAEQAAAKGENAAAGNAAMPAGSQPNGTPVPGASGGAAATETGHGAGTPAASCDADTAGTGAASSGTSDGAASDAAAPDGGTDTAADTAGPADDSDDGDGMSL